MDKLWAMPMVGVEKLPLETNWMPAVLKDHDEIQRINNHVIKPGTKKPIVFTYPFVSLQDDRVPKDILRIHDERAEAMRNKEANKALLRKSASERAELHKKKQIAQKYAYECKIEALAPLVPTDSHLTVPSSPRLDRVSSHILTEAPDIMKKRLPSNLKVSKEKLKEQQKAALRKIRHDQRLSDQLNKIYDMVENQGVNADIVKETYENELKKSQRQKFQFYDFGTLRTADEFDQPFMDTLRDVHSSLRNNTLHLLERRRARMSSKYGSRSALNRNNQL